MTHINTQPTAQLIASAVLYVQPSTKAYEFIQKTISPTIKSLLNTKSITSKTAQLSSLPIRWQLLFPDTNSTLIMTIDSADSTTLSLSGYMPKKSYILVNNTFIAPLQSDGSFYHTVSLDPLSPAAIDIEIIPNTL